MTQRPRLVIAHRGASGYLPEHTLEAYALAYGMGADFVEPDLVLTRDGHFICLHDIHLEATTDVETRFPDRRRDDGRWYAADFSLAEIKQLRVHERLPGRFPMTAGGYELPTFVEMVEMIQGLNLALGRSVGIYPELKAPSWHREAGLPMEESFLELVRGYGYQGPDAAIFVQSFEADSLQRLRALGSDLPHVYLLGDGAESRARLTRARIGELRSFADGIGPAKTLIAADPDLVRRAHAADLLVHPYTFRADQPGVEGETFEEELLRYLEGYGVDGLFTDHPDRALALRRGASPTPDP